VRLIFERQWLHVIGLVVLLVGCEWFARLSSVGQGELWGFNSIRWYWLAILTAVLHQIYVWFFWRIELHGQAMSRFVGSGAFKGFAIGFAIIGICRVLWVFFSPMPTKAALWPIRSG
jgi:hypothetical protein